MKLDRSDETTWLLQSVFVVTICWINSTILVYPTRNAWKGGENSVPSKHRGGNKYEHTIIYQTYTSYHSLQIRTDGLRCTNIRVQTTLDDSIILCWFSDKTCSNNGAHALEKGRIPARKILPSGNEQEFLVV